jgi:hypothetical protein
MLDVLVRNGRAVTPEGAGVWDVAVGSRKIDPVMRRRPGC